MNTPSTLYNQLYYAYGCLITGNISGITVSSPSAQSLSYDANGNQTNTAASSYPQYSYDAENRLVKITYDSTGTNYTTLVYDPFYRLVSIAETGTSPSYSGNATKQFVYLGASKLEERDGSGNLSDGKPFFSDGQINFSGGTGTERDGLSRASHFAPQRRLVDLSAQIVNGACIVD